MPKARISDPLTAAQLRAVLDYDPTTGVFTWRRRPRKDFATTRAWHTWNSRYAGKRAGSPTVPRGYIQIMVRKRLYLAQRLAWRWMTGRWPKPEVDHRDTNPGNNAWANLRQATSSQNKANARLRSDNTSGFKGVSWNARRHNWTAEILFKGKKRNLGDYDTPEEASAARTEAASRLHGEFTRSF